MDTNTKNSTKTENQVYYTQGDNKIERNYNHYAEEIDSLNNKMINSFDHMNYIEKIPDSDQMTSSDKKRAPFPINDKNSAKEQMTSKKQKRKKQPCYDTS